jgi:flagellar protein FliS
MDIDAIDEVARLMIDIKGAWDQIPADQRDVAMNQMQQAAGA